MGRLFGGAVLALCLTLSGLSPADEPDWGSLPYTPFNQMQAVNPETGAPAWTIPTPGGQQAYRLRGVVLNNPADMLDGTANYLEGPLGAMGGQWQVFIQAVALDGDAENHPELVGDFGGAALWMGQNYGNHYWHYGNWSYNYTNEQWLAELARLNLPMDLGTGAPVTEPLRAGDLIEVRATQAAHYRGKYNCNEYHDNDPACDFDVYILQRDLPLAPAVVTLEGLMDSAGKFLFDGTRATGGEFYQAQYVTLRGVSITTPEAWTPYGKLTVTDGVRTFLVRLGNNAAFASANLPSGPLDITGIFDQDSGTLKDGYLMWATEPGQFRPSGEPLAGDANADGMVNDLDASILAANWQQTSGAGWFDADFNGDRAVDDLDASILAANWQAGVGPAGSVPEPSTLMLLGTAALLLGSEARRRR